MKSIVKTLLFPALLLGLLVGMTSRADAKPVRVLFLKVVYKGGFIQSSIKNGTPYLEAMLADPGGLTGPASLINPTLGTGDSILIPRDGFRIDTIGNGTNATEANIRKFVTLLDSVDVLVMLNTIGMGGILGSDSDRVKFLHFADTKGIVSVFSANDPHSSSSNAPTWPAYDSLCGALFKDWATASVNVLRDTLPFNTADSTFPLLNRGLLPQYRLVELWMSYTKNPRFEPGMHVLYTLNEADYTPSTRMGDHPVTWYRETLSGNGGRYFYTGLGRTDSLFQKNYFFRRQLYNAVIWASRYDSATGGIPSTVKAREVRAGKTGVFHATVSGSTLIVTPTEAEGYTVEIRTPDGRQITSVEARDGRPTTLSLRPHALYSVTVKSSLRRRSALVAMP